MGSYYQCIKSGRQSANERQRTNGNQPRWHGVDEGAGRRECGPQRLGQRPLVGRIESEQWERRHATDPRNLSLEDWYAEAANKLGISMGRFGTAENLPISPHFGI